MKKFTLLIVTVFCFSGFAMADTPISFGTTDWAPYMGKNLQNGGPLVDIAKAALKKAGYDMKIDYMDWNRAVALTEAGKLDGVLGCYGTPERAKTLNISTKIGEAANVFFVKKGSNIKYSSLDDLKQYKIGIMRGFVYTSEFDAASYLKKEPVDSMDINIKKLLKGRIDVVVGSRMVVQDLLNKKFPQDVDKIVVVGEPLTVNTLHVGFSKELKDGDKIVADFNKGLKMIQDDGTVKTILNSHGF